jgi:hypothetical protein
MMDWMEGFGYPGCASFEEKKVSGGRDSDVCGRYLGDYGCMEFLRVRFYIEDGNSNS